MRNDFSRDIYWHIILSDKSLDLRYKQKSTLSMVHIEVNQTSPRVKVTLHLVSSTCIMMIMKANGSKKKITLPIKAAEPPNLEIPTATLAGAPPAAFLKPSASARETPAVVGTKSINISPKQTTSVFLFWTPFFLEKESDLNDSTRGSIA